MDEKQKAELQKSAHGLYRFHASDDADKLSLAETKASFIFQGFKEHTTSHGVSHIHNARGSIKRTFWIIISLGMVTGLIVNLSYLVNNFLDFKVNVVIEMQHNRQLTFPAVTICNMNPVLRSQLHLVPELEVLLSNETKSNETQEGEPVPGSQYPERVLPRESFQMEERVAAILADLDDSTKESIGYKAKDMILDCQYSGYNCFWQDFAHFFNSIHGNCYIFNSGWLNETVRLSYKTGRRYGLKLVLNVDQGEYVNNLGESAGVRVVVHPQDRMPFPQDEGIVVSPGILTSIGLRQITVSHKPLPYGNCTDRSKKNISRNVFEEYYQVAYSNTACYKTCFQRYLIDSCKCADPMVPKSGVAVGDVAGILACDPDNIIQDDCKYLVNSQFNAGLLPCDECVLACNEYTYEPEISTVAWPSDIKEESVLEKFNDPSAGIDSPASDPDLFKRNLLKLEVYFEEFNYEDIAERPATTAFQFASDIGGVLGLYIGWSLMTLFEFFELGLDLFVLGLITLFFKLRPRNTAKANEKGEAANVISKQKQQSKDISHSAGYKQAKVQPYYTRPLQSPKYI